MSRSLKKGPYVDENIIKRISNLRQGDQTVVKTWARGSTISPEMVGFKIGVHNGKTHTTILIVEDMVGHKLGEFSPTRKFTRHGGRMAREEASAVAQKEATAVKNAAEPAKAAPAKKE
jgi:small subunit ribosomal protein S19